MTDTGIPSIERKKDSGARSYPGPHYRRGFENLEKKKQKGRLIEGGKRKMEKLASLLDNVEKNVEKDEKKNELVRPYVLSPGVGRIGKKRKGPYFI